MNKNTKETAEKLKEIMQGKSETNEIDRIDRLNERRLLKDRIRELGVQNKRHQTELNRMKHDFHYRAERRHRASVQPEPAVQIDIIPQDTDDMITEVAGQMEATIPLPPAPTQLPVKRPDSGEDITPDIDLPAVLKTMLTSSKHLEKPVFKFEVSDEAATFNMELLRQNNFELGRLLNYNKSITSYGSEFKSTDELEPLLRRHPRWNELKQKLSEGACFPVTEIDDKTRLLDLEAMISRGNHRSAKIHESYLAEAFTKEIEKGWNLILPEDEAMTIPGLEIAPMGVADQLGISATGDFVSKLRVTHDLSFPQEASKASLNSRVNEEELEPCMFGHTLLRLVHHIVHLRLKYPKQKIWLRKEDFKSAYRRMHLNERTALQTSVRVKLNGKFYILVSLRLPFGGSPCPSDFCLISDIITDTINDLLACTSWDPEVVWSEYVKNIPMPRPLPSDIPYAPARSLSVNLTDEPCAKADCFVDDIMSITVDNDDNLLRLATAPCTVIHAMAHNADGDTHLLRQDLISAEKNEAEGAPEEVKVCLGWQFNTRLLLIALPRHKFEAWDRQILDIIEAKSVKYKLLESVLGRLENVAIILKMFGHFLNNIRSLQIKAAQSQHNQKLSKNAIAEFELSRKFVAKAHAGVSMNNLVFRRPNRIHIGDASEHGLGGMCTQNGKAWRYLIPTKLQGRAHINLLEFLIQVVSIWLDIECGNVRPQDCILAMGDNTTAAGWCRRTNFREKI